MNSLLNIKNDFGVFVSLAIYVFFVMFFVSSDSYTHDMYGRWDSAWFFMCGKALMNGMTPYVDYTDSKGLFLWVIYGLGYLLSPRNYLGVFWISCAAYTVTFYCVYRLAKLLLKDARCAIVCTLLMTLAFFNNILHSETRAEDFCLAFLVVSLYRTSLLLYSECVSAKTIDCTFLLLGFCFGSIFMIKYNIAAMQSIFVLYSLVWVIRERRGWLRAILLLLIGFAVVVLPMVLFMIGKGCFGDFIHEYFYNTIQTVTGGESNIILYLRDWQSVLADKYRIALLVAIVIGCLMFARHADRYRWFPLVSSFFIYALTTRHAYWIYYYLSCSFLLFWLMLSLSRLPFFASIRHHLMAMAIVIGGFCAVLNMTLGNYYQTMFWNDGKARTIFYDMQYLMSQVDSPTLFYAFQADQGYGIVCGALPGGKYWAKQNGATNDMNEEHKRELLSGKSDFVFVKHPERLLRNGVTKDMLEDIGYQVCYKFGESYLLTKRNVSHPSVPVHLTNWDILFKRYPAPFKIE